jgi:hypothetical protein
LDALFEFETQLLLMRIAKLVIEIAGLALVGQGLVYVLTRGIGQDPSRNFFYRVLQITVSPFTWLVRKVTPRVVDDRHIPIAVFGVLAFAYAFVLFGIANACISHGYTVAECRRIR